MSILSDDIASSFERRSRDGTPSEGLESIATEVQQLVNPEWNVCIDALIKIWKDPSSLSDPKPNRTSIEAALKWTIFLKKRFPSAPPTCIIAEPNGGIIVERRITSANGQEFLWELTFYNDGSAERTDYLDGRVLRMISIPRDPSD